MPPDQIFKRWVHIALFVFSLSFIYFLCADLWMPVSTQSRVLHPVVNVSAKVTGQVNKVYVQNNEKVNAEQILFSLDPLSYEIAVDKAKLALEGAKQTNLQLDASIAAAKAQLMVSTTYADELKLEVNRVEPLIKSNTVSRQLYDQTITNYRAALAQIEVKKADIVKFIAQRGTANEDNLLIRQAKNTLKHAELQLSYTNVRSKVKGYVTNLQLQTGNYAQAGSSLLAIVLEKSEIIADFREKSLSHVKLGDSASIVFDALPGKVFDGKIVSIDAGVKDGQINANGSLADPVNSDRWVRDAQYMRTHVALIDQPQLLRLMPTGSRATVQLHPIGGIAHWLGKTQAYVISIIHYIY